MVELSERGRVVPVGNGCVEEAAADTPVGSSVVPQTADVRQRASTTRALLNQALQRAHPSLTFDGAGLTHGSGGGAE